MRKGPKAYLAFGPCFMRTQPTCPIRIRAWQIYRPPLVFAVAASTAFKSYSLTSHCAKLVSSSPSAPIRKSSDAFTYLKGTMMRILHTALCLTGNAQRPGVAHDVVVLTAADEAYFGVAPAHLVLHLAHRKSRGFARYPEVTDLIGFVARNGFHDVL